MKILIIGVISLISIPIATIVALIMFHLIALIIRAILLRITPIRVSISKYYSKDDRYARKNHQGNINFTQNIPYSGNGITDKFKYFINSFYNELCCFWLPFKRRRQNQSIHYLRKENQQCCNESTNNDTPDMVNQITDSQVKQFDHFTHIKRIINRGDTKCK